jgi:NADPH:quinone reductase-like Zn-dependent oxidoreductase
VIQGASGGVGTFAVQIAKALGAEVTAVCGAGHVEQARALGADHALDYTREDFTKKRGKQRRRYDLILAVGGYHSLFAYRRALRPNGRYVLVGASTHIFRALFQALLLGPMISRMGSRQLGGFLARPTQQDLLFVKELLEAGTVAPVIDRRYPFGETAEALRYVEEGHAGGKVVITM